jgi:AraC family transcriptional regulator of arabinose operon
MYELREFFNLIDPESELQVLYAGEQQCQPGHAHAGRRHHALWHFVVRGHGRVVNAESSWDLGPGDSFLFLPDQTMSYEADREDPWRYQWLGLGGRRIVHHLSRCGFSPQNIVNRGGALAPAIAERAGTLLGLLADTGEAREADSLTMQSCLYGLLELLSRVPQARKGPRAAIPYVRELVALLETAYSRKLTAASLARYAGLERTYCARLFQQETGVGMMQYLTRVRMGKARALLRETKMTVKAVAESVGYPNDEAFSKRFKLVFGLTPTGFREGLDPAEGTLR